MPPRRPVTHSRLVRVCVLALLCCACAMRAAVPAPAASPSDPPARDAIWLQPCEGLLPEMAALVPQLPGGADTLLIDYFSGGRVVGMGCSIFPRNPWLTSKVDHLGALIAAAHGRGIRVFVALDLLRWETPARDSGSRLFARYPALRELPLVPDPRRASDEAYASPWHPEVLRALAELMRETAARYPALDGVCFTCRLPTANLYGYSDAARQAYIREKGIDPADLRFRTEHAEMRALVQEWVLWRRVSLARLLGTAADAFRESMRQERKKVGLPLEPGPRVAAEAYAPLYAQGEETQARIAEDWVRWTEGSLVEELIPTLDPGVGWSGPGTSGALANMQELLARVEHPVGVRPRITVRYAGTADAVRRERAALMQDGTAKGVVLVVSDRGELDRAIAALSPVEARAALE